MIFLQWIACWACYYIGDLVSKILNLNNNSDAWVYFWYTIYSTLMLWSNKIQHAAGYDPHSGADVSEWVWQKPEDNTGES